MLTGCASSMNVSSYVEHVLDVSRYRTYDWGPADALPTGDPRLDRNSFFRDHMEGAVEKQLAARGMERSAPGKADLLIHYHASIDRRLNVNAADRQYGYCSADDCPAYVSEYEEGTLVLDVVDTARTGSSGAAGPRTTSNQCSTIQTRWNEKSTKASRG
jgi:hypothetical protein